MKEYKEIENRSTKVQAVDQSTSATKVILVNKQENIEFGVDTFGDSLMERLNFIFISNANDCEKALSFAVAASYLKHTIYGDYNCVIGAEVEKLLNGDASGRVMHNK